MLKDVNPVIVKFNFVALNDVVAKTKRVNFNECYIFERHNRR